MLSLRGLATDSGPIYELKNSAFLGFVSSCQTCKLLSSDRKLAFTSMSGSDWHTSKQKVYNWPSDKDELRPHHDRLASSRPSHAIRKPIGINSDPRTTTTARPPWHTCDGHHRITTNLLRLATKRRSSFELGHSQVKFPRPKSVFWRLKAIVDLLVSNIGGTYDLADQLPSNHEFSHFWGS